MREEYLFTQGCLLPGVLINGDTYTRERCLYLQALICNVPGVLIVQGCLLSRGTYTLVYLYPVVRIPGGGPYVYPGVLIRGGTYTRGYAYPVVRIPGGTYIRGYLYSEVFILAVGYMLWYLFPVLMSRDTYSWGAYTHSLSFSRGACTRLVVQDNDCIFIKLLLNITQTSHIFFFVLSR